MIIYRFIKYLVLYIQYTSVLNKVYKDEDMIKKLSSSFGTEFKKDWVCRLYTVFNPNLKNGQFDPSNPIYTYNEQGLNTDEFVKTYILTKLGVIDHYVKTMNLFDLVTYDIKRLDEYDNFLFVIEPLPWKNFVKYLKLLPISIIIIIVLIIGLTILL